MEERVAVVHDVAGGFGVDGVVFAYAAVFAGEPFRSWTPTTQSGLIRIDRVGVWESGEEVSSKGVDCLVWVYVRMLRRGVLTALFVDDVARHDGLTRGLLRAQTSSSGVFWAVCATLCGVGCWA